MLEMNGLISICIPAFNRPGLLRQALDSCLEQTYADYEIVIGDDSKNDLSEQVVREYAAAHPGKIRYQRNSPSLGQAANVNDLFARARGERLVLLHDDDMLMPTALEHLAGCWTELPTLDAAFGKQYFTDSSGKTLIEESEKLNVKYYRIPANSGRQPVTAIPGLLRMFPNDGYMVRTEVARHAGYRSREKVGEACDTDFGLRVCIGAREVWFVNEYTSKYRDSDDAVSKRNYLQPYTYDMLAAADVPEAAMEAKQLALKEIAPSATSCFARIDRPGKALSVLLSPHYTVRDKLRVRALYHVYLIAASCLRKVTRSLRPNLGSS
jgi:glycosyltransferase involved in cell wall biosynthesis